MGIFNIEPTAFKALKKSLNLLAFLKYSKNSSGLLNET